MTREELFLAIGEVEESRLLRSELTVQDSSAMIQKEESAMKKRSINTGRMIRNLIAAVMIVTMLAVTAYAVVGYVIFDSPEEMITSIFGDKTGYDHKDITYWSDPEKPGSQYTNPAFDRVEADETVVAEDVAPYVSPVGQSISYGDYTLTVDGFLYDEQSGCGFVTYLLENPKGVSCYEVFENGMLNLNGAPHGMNQYGYDYIIEEKTTDTCLAATFYLQNSGVHLRGEDLVISFPSEEEPRTDEEIHEIIMELDEQIRAEFTPDEAVEKAKEELGEVRFEDFSGMPDSLDMTQEEWRAECAYVYLRDVRYFAEYDQIGPHITIPLEGSALKHVTAGNGSILVTPISFQIDVTNLEFLHEVHDGETYINADNVDSVSILYEDGEEYILRGDAVDNTVFGVIDSASNGEKDIHNQLTYMFNRIIDVDKVTSVLINGVELTVD